MQTSIENTRSAGQNQHRGHIAVQRAIADLRRGAAVVIRNQKGYAGLVRAAEQISDDALSQLAGQSASTPYLLITTRRARAMGLAPKAEAVACSITLPPRVGPNQILELIGDLPMQEIPSSLPILAEKKSSMAALALMLMRSARLLPAAVAAAVPVNETVALRRWAEDRGLLMVEEKDILLFEERQARQLQAVARARLPLAEAENTEIVIFRPGDGGTEHFALIVSGTDSRGNAESKDTVPPLVRIHSQCITGDLLGSLKCDCGDQLRLALRQMRDAGGGVLIYLAQEGRDIGLVNKLRAYGLQDQGMDTVDANHTLGFETDHRYFMPAAEMLRQLGHQQIRLLTNNPEKIRQLEECGITVSDRISLVTASNPHNAGYLRTKADRTGHLLGQND